MVLRAVAVRPAHARDVRKELLTVGAPFDVGVAGVIPLVALFSAVASTGRVERQRLVVG